MFAGMHDASALVVGATLAAARAVWTGATQHGASIAGGLHHAMRARASGFCVYDDPAIAISWLLAAGARRVAYVDIGVHHADGVQAAFYDSPQVLTIRLHEHPATAFPGTGLPSETGGPEARGSAVNVALPAGTADAGWLRALDGVVPPLDPRARIPGSSRQYASLRTGQEAPELMTEATIQHSPGSSPGTTRPIRSTGPSSQPGELSSPSTG